ncbi:hypothetical protein [Flavitalea sp.]|nr:hypothetical protein [Flavitalea sp.]
MKYNFAVSSKQVLIVILVMTITCAQTFAQDSMSTKQPATTSNKWRFLAELYLMFPNMEGQSGLGTLPEVDVDANPGDIFDKLQIAAMLYFEAANDRWAFSSDLIYMSLEQDLTAGRVIKSGEANAKQFAWELAGMRKLIPGLEAGIGLRLNSMKMDLDLVQNNVGGGSTNRNRSTTETWVDPFIVARLKSDPVKKFIYQLRGDIGGFGVGSDFAWQVQAYAGYRFSKLFQITAGYRVLGMNYDKGNDENRFLYDMNIFGPVLKFGFNF